MCALPKSGMAHFHAYATVSIVRDDWCYVVALHFIEYGEEMADIVHWLIKRLKTLQICIRRAFLDKGLFPASFQCSGPAQAGLRHIDSHTWQIGRCAAIVSKQVLQNKLYLQQSKTWSIYCSDCGCKALFERKIWTIYSKWFAYAVTGLPVGILPAQVFELYRQSFGFESSYRQMN